VLIDRVGGVGSFRPMSCEEGPEAYERLIDPVDTFDVVHLGLGPDGHTASLFPRSSALEAPPGRLVVLSVDPNDLNAHERMTLTLEALARAQLVVFTVSGESKREAFAAVSSGADLPASRVRARQILWLVDREASGQVGPTGDDG
jgi:6-phosphogluconolactonase/glucosamine-6-phosphate isomerase/deaminase